jgi:hypothetical protein
MSASSAKGQGADEITLPIAPAQAGAYRAYRFSLTHDIGTSLRWCDGVLRMLLTMSGVR